MFYLPDSTFNRYGKVTALFAEEITEGPLAARGWRRMPTLSQRSPRETAKRPEMARTPRKSAPKFCRLPAVRPSARCHWRSCQSANLVRLDIQRQPSMQTRWQTASRIPPIFTKEEMPTTGRSPDEKPSLCLRASPRCSPKSRPTMRDL